MIAKGLIVFLERRGWRQVRQTDNYVYFTNVESFKGVEIKVPLFDGASDYDNYLLPVIDNLSRLYPDSKFYLDKIKTKLSVYMRKFSPNKELWIMPLDRFKVDKIGIFDIYLPEKYRNQVQF